MRCAGCLLVWALATSFLTHQSPELIHLDMRHLLDSSVVFGGLIELHLGALLITSACGCVS